MKYLKIANNGLLDIRLIALMGGSTKSADHTKIGQFGTGLKYAIAYLVRHEVKFKLFVGEEEVLFESKDENISGKYFKEIYCNGKSMNITTHYGYQWKAWEALREIYCNSLDEGGTIKQVVNSEKGLTGKTNTTTFYIELNKEINDVNQNWGQYFYKDKPLFEDANVAIYLNPGETLKLYKNGVLIQESEYYKSLFTYDLKQANLNELRQYQGYLSSDIGRSVLSANNVVIQTLIEAIKDDKKADMYEVKLDWSYLTYTKDHVKDIFSGYLYLHPASDKGSEKSVKVSQTLFDLLTKCGLPTERINKSSGGWYGGSGLGHRQADNISYKEVLSPSLQKKIQAIAIKYGSNMKYCIAMPKETDFDFVVSGDKVIFNFSIGTCNDADLEATVLVAIMHTQESNIYKAFKRLIRYAVANRNFKKMLFGRNIGAKVKPTYQAPDLGSALIELEDEFLPF